MTLGCQGKRCERQICTYSSLCLLSVHKLEMSKVSPVLESTGCPRAKEAALVIYHPKVHFQRAKYRAWWTVDSGQSLCCIPCQTHSTTKTNLYPKCDNCISIIVSSHKLKFPIYRLLFRICNSVSSRKKQTYPKVEKQDNSIFRKVTSR